MAFELQKPWEVQEPDSTATFSERKVRMPRADLPSQRLFPADESVVVLPTDLSGNLAKRPLFCCLRRNLCVEWSDFSAVEVNCAFRELKIRPVAPSTLSPHFSDFNADFLDSFVGFGSVQTSLSHCSFILSELGGGGHTHTYLAH